MEDQNLYEKWLNEVYFPTIHKYQERKPNFSTSSGIELDPVYIPAEKDQTNSENLGFPGAYPFTRGVQPSMYRGRFWTMRQYAGYASAKESNERYRFLLDQGQTGLSVAFDLPTQIGYDADDPISMGEVGKVGVSISSLQDMEILFRNIPLDKVSTSMTINAPAAILLAAYIAVGKKQGIEPKKLRGTIQNDILKEYVARGTYIYPPTPSMRLITDTFKYCKLEVPNWNTISISGYHIREAGSTAVQEVAFTLANAIAYIQAAIDAGLEVDDFASQLSFFFNSHNNFLEEVAKFRAARRLYAKIMRDRFHAKNDNSMKLRFHTQTAGSTLTAKQPENNVVRVTLQALAAVLGGTQSLHTNSMDEALWLPTQKSVQVALRTQQIIANESGVADVIDPMAGSYAIEYLTDQIESAAAQYINKIDSLGGALKAIEIGYMQSEIQEAAYEFQIKMEKGEEVIVGVNQFTSNEEITLDALKINPQIENEQHRNLAELRSNRDHDKVAELLSQVEMAARGSENLMPLFIACMENSVTLGEICKVLRIVWGEYQAPSFL